MNLCASIRRDLEAMIPKNFLEIYPDERLNHLPRYLKAMEIRAERGAYDIVKDRKKESDAEVFKKIMEEIKNEASEHISREKQEALEEFRWMLEEYKVSLFAPELKTAFPVSQKRLKKRADEIRRML
jgi:ATP-dependent helicase HrpA